MDIIALHATVSPQTGGDSDGNENAKEEEKQPLERPTSFNLAVTKGKLGKAKNCLARTGLLKTLKAKCSFFPELGPGLV